MRLNVQTDYLVRVIDADEARIALEGGADRIEFCAAANALAADGIADVVRLARGQARVSAPAGALSAQTGPEALHALADLGVDAVIIDAGPSAAEQFDAIRTRHPALRGIARFTVAAGQLPDLSRLGALAEAGVRTAMLEREDVSALRLIDHPGVEGLAQFVEAAQRRGLEAGLGGGLEAPDVPRMLALGPDILAFRRLLCSDRQPPRLDRDRVAMMREMIPRTADGGAGLAQRPSDRSGLRDKVFVRDFVVEAGIGAYRHEHRAPQRMRFNVEADLVPIAQTVTDMRDVFSYDVIVDAIRLATRRHTLLVERVALDVANATLRDRRVQRVRVRIEKLDILDGSVGVEIEREATG